MYRFMAGFFSISEFYITQNSFILLMVVSCATHARSKVEVQNSLPTFICTNITTLCLLFIFRCDQNIFFALNITCTKRLFIFIHSCSNFFVVFQFLRLYCLVDVSNCFVDFFIFLLAPGFKKLD